MGYSDDPAMVRVDFFKPGGKWYDTEAVRWTGAYNSLKRGGQPAHEAFKTSLRDHLQGRMREMTAVCLEPYHEHGFPLMIKDGKWEE